MCSLNKKKIDIVVYTVPGCHLCDEAVALLASFQAKYRLNIQVIDILSDPELVEKYQHDVPVVLANGRELFCHKIKEKELNNLLKKIQLIKESL